MIKDSTQLRDMGRSEVKARDVKGSDSQSSLGWNLNRQRSMFQTREIAICI